MSMRLPVITLVEETPARSRVLQPGPRLDALFVEFGGSDKKLIGGPFGALITRSIIDQSADEVNRL